MVFDVDDRETNERTKFVERPDAGPALAIDVTAPQTILNGHKAVTTAGTAEQLLATSLTVKGVIIKALATNTGYIYVGSAGVTETTGTWLAAGEALPFDINDLSVIYLNSSVSVETASFFAVV